MRFTKLLLHLLLHLECLCKNEKNNVVGCLSFCIFNKKRLNNEMISVLKIDTF